MTTHHWPEASHGDDSDSSDTLRRWIPVVVPLCAVVFGLLILLIGWEILSRP